MTADTIIRITSRGRECSALDPAAVPNGRVVEMLLDAVHHQNRADARVLRCILEVAQRDPDAPFTVVAALAIGPRAADVSQPVPGKFHFVTPLGQTYITREEQPWAQPPEPEPEPDEDVPPF
jgi:hypothetical protein